MTLASQTPDTGGSTERDGDDLVQRATELRALFHRLNNQLGIVLAHAELLEAKATDDVSRARASQVVAAILDAMATARDIRQHTDPAAP